MDYSFHEIANVFPMLAEPELEDLADDIDKHGLHHPIVLFEGKILDGRNRYTACTDVGYELTEASFTTFTGTWDEAKAFVVSENLQRRHLSTSQRTMVADRLANLQPGRPEKTASNEAVSRSQSEAAGLLNVSRSGVQRAAQVRQHGVPELGRLVDAGEVSVSAASKVAREPKPLQRKLIEKFDSEDAEEREEARRRLREHVRTRSLGTTFERVDSLADLRQAGTSVRKFATWLADNSSRLDTNERSIVTKIVNEITLGCSWINSILSGGGLNDADLAAWLEEGENPS